MFGACVDIQQGVEQGAHRQRHEQDGERQRHIADKQRGGFAQARYQVQAELNHQRWRHLRQAMKDFVVPQVVEPMQRRLPAEQFDGVENEVTRYPSEQQGHHQ